MGGPIRKEVGVEKNHPICQASWAACVFGHGNDIYEDLGGEFEYFFALFFSFPGAHAVYGRFEERRNLPAAAGKSLFAQEKRQD